MSTLSQGCTARHCSTAGSVLCIMSCSVYVCRFAHPAGPAPTPPPAVQPVCRYWRFGTCRYGSACRFRSDKLLCCMQLFALMNIVCVTTPSWGQHCYCNCDMGIFYATYECCTSGAAQHLSCMKCCTVLSILRKFVLAHFAAVCIRQRLSAFMDMNLFGGWTAGIHCIPSQS